ncbi:hypothetical protein ARBITER_22 [Mycobacterium phage Arbiter]|uniref:Phage zinc binding domain-containing protein n=6 Tax=Rosebushvirus TaxID=1982900 RepID=S5WK15_9CAUD|nr:hypothetical protein FPF50_gp22 [Mycobacterium phage TA17A]AEN79591.1 hypothetical protein ARBITER_22 [Mycobacterium phage Arbiter]AIK68796.1 hypothetical protein PBI_LIZLEMON_22 [Mycobacterium phage LizLemon]AUX82230.1 hypothetical protein SEA_ITSYBITSY1_22 [Mycobacterium phage ItsyBitsy1]QFG13976.1 hypothetical protein SEA_RHINOFORTE_22 [Mycobacterium phage Rhinoforte]QHB36719.1 hypothetical protein SEA_LEPHLEUR_22 [Mycobacterium phage Lephleur]UAW08994.1 hypothetical protein SEA_CALAMIT
MRRDPADVEEPRWCPECGHPVTDHDPTCQFYEPEPDE